VVGIDLSPRMVERTAADVRELPHVEVQVGDASAPAFAPGSFDVLASCLVLFFLPDPAAAVAAWTPLLADGGRVGVTTFGEQDPRWRAVDEVFVPYLPAGMRDARTSGARGPFGSDEGVEGLLRAAGLVDVRTAHRTVEVTFDDPEQWLTFTWSHGQRAMWEAVPQERRDEVRDAAFDTLRSYSDLTFRQPVRHTLGRRG
jgi:SAM-dependent methyltransferase